MTTIPREIARELDRIGRDIRLLGGGTVRQAVAGTHRSSSSTNLTDGCECNNDLLIEGVPMEKQCEGTIFPNNDDVTDPVEPCTTNGTTGPGYWCGFFPETLSIIAPPRPSNSGHCDVCGESEY